MELFFLKEVDSTNKYAKEHIEELADKTVVYTDNQTAGRGRLNRIWNYQGEDNIYASLVLKPSNKMEEVYSNLTQLLCLSLAITFEKYNVVPQIKWPNDILINNKKISGILAESVGINDTKNGKYILQGLILGFGINLNTKIENLSKINQAATSLNIETGQFIDRKIFLKILLDNFCLMYDKFIENGFILIKDEYVRRASFLNKEITVRVFDKTIVGFAKEITDNGALKLLDKNNNEHILLIGDIL